MTYDDDYEAPMPLPGVMQAIFQAKHDCEMVQAKPPRAIEVRSMVGVCRWFGMDPPKDRDGATLAGMPVEFNANLGPDEFVIVGEYDSWPGRIPA